jgi:hypothetical protein
MYELDNLQRLVIEQVRKTEDADLLDLILKLFLTETPARPEAA